MKYLFRFFVALALVEMLATHSVSFALFAIYFAALVTCLSWGMHGFEGVLQLWSNVFGFLEGRDE